MKQITAYLAFVLAAAFALSPAFTSPFTGFTEDQLPIPQINPPVQPAGYAFAIWGLIYLWLIVSGLFGAIKRAKADDWHRARLPLIVSLAVGVPWLAIANASAIWATITIWVMAGSAVLALLRAPFRDRWLFQAPVGLYAGWLTAASCVSLATVMAGYGIGPKAAGWAVAAIGLAFVLAWSVHRRRRNAPEYLAAVIWALVGIVLANWATDGFVALLAGIGAMVLFIRALSSPQEDPPIGLYR
ncbi:MAG: hypothetical protein AAF891_03710 [Pseudomonadota bacterium]